MAKKQLSINGKKLSIFLILTLAGLVAFGTFKYNEFQKELDYVQSENNDLNDRVEELESANDDLESELSDAKTELEESETNYENVSSEYRSLLDAQIRVSEFNSNNYKDYSTTSTYSSNYNQKSTGTYNIPSTLSTQYFDGGYIIKPSFENLHCLLKLSFEEFRSKMTANDYSLSTDGNSYVSDGATNCCYTIEKEYDNVVLYFSKRIDSDIESIMTKSKINYTYDNGFKKYSYRINNQDYEIHLKKESDFLGLILKRT